MFTPHPSPSPLTHLPTFYHIDNDCQRSILRGKTFVKYFNDQYGQNILLSSIPPIGGGGVVGCITSTVPLPVALPASLPDGFTGAGAVGGS